MKKALRLSVVWQALLFFLLFCVGAYLYIGASRSVVDLCPSAITTSHSGALPDLKPDSNPELTPGSCMPSKASRQFALH